MPRDSLKSKLHTDADLLIFSRAQMISSLAARMLASGLDSPRVQQLRTLVASATEGFSQIYVMARTSPTPLAEQAAGEAQRLQNQLDFLSLLAPDSARQLAFPGVSAFSPVYRKSVGRHLNDQLLTSPGDNLVLLVKSIDRLVRTPDSLHSVAEFCSNRRIKMSVLAFFDWTTLSKNASEALFLNDTDSFDLWRNAVCSQECFPNSQRPVVQPHFVFQINTSGVVIFNPHRDHEVEANFVSSRVHLTSYRARLQRTIAIPEIHAPVTRDLVRNVLGVDLSIVTHRSRAAVSCPCLTRPHDGACVCGCASCRVQARCQIPGHSAKGLVTNARHGKVCQDCGKTHNLASLRCRTCHIKSRGPKTCKLCGKTYTGSTLHCQRCHEKSRNKTCKLCGRPHTSSTLHCRRCHEKLRNKTCPDCRKTHTTKSLRCRRCQEKLRQPRTCGLCGNTHTADTLYCPKCYRISRKKT